MKKLFILLIMLLLVSCSASKGSTTPVVKDTIPCEITAMNQSQVILLQQKKIKKEENKSLILYVLLSLLVAVTGFELIKN